MSVVFTETGERITLAAGAVLMRGVGNKREIALVHRPAYNDWSLPKGKPNKGELAPATAVREVEEETGIRIRLGPALQDVRYRIPRGPKVVRFWVGHELRSSERKPDQEIDDVVWLKVTAARKRMTYADERLVLDQAVALPETTPFLLVRHTRATPRARWRGDDRLRPLDQTGRKQALRLIPLLDAFGVRQLTSSSSERCRQTLAPYARSTGLPVKPASLLSEEVGEDHLAGVERYVRKQAVKAAHSKVPAVVCGHRPVLPAMLAGLQIPARPMPVGAVLVVHVDGAGHVVGHEWHGPRK